MIDLGLDSQSHMFLFLAQGACSLSWLLSNVVLTRSRVPWETPVSVRDFLYWVNWGGEIHANCGCCQCIGGVLGGIKGRKQAEFQHLSLSASWLDLASPLPSYGGLSPPNCEPNKPSHHEPFFSATWSHQWEKSRIHPLNDMVEGYPKVLAS